MTFKVLLLGDSGVGKTTLRTQYLHKTFTLSYRATSGANFITKKVQVHAYPATGSPNVCASRDLVSLCLWDTAGQERFNALSPSFFRGADAALLLYDCAAPDTIQRLKHHLANFLKYSGTANPVVLLIGNKCDLECLVTPGLALAALDKSHSLDTAAEWYTIHEDVAVREVSARTGLGVDALFREVAQRCHDREARRELLAFEVEEEEDSYRQRTIPCDDLLQGDVLANMLYINKLQEGRPISRKMKRLIVRFCTFRFSMKIRIIIWICLQSRM